ncbi:GNAT family N-acetyltransferase [Photobacterium piscicola]|uniref:GNAT family N-acetyltransferase n=1 Tax=Photobacterium piscicola TaxID=1378299 RepID=UPI002E1982D8|nr:GNAT family N-acetyltransferase [Photobacterium piscicola]
MLDIQKIESIATIKQFKEHYFAQTTAPLDGMWHLGFVPISQHFGFYENDSLVGYCCINSEGYLLQYYLSPVAKISPSELFLSITQKNNHIIGSITGAFVSTAEPHFLSLCLDNAASVIVHSLMYCGTQHKAFQRSSDVTLTIATTEQLDIFIDFAVMAIGAPKEWLTGYFKGLISRQELFGYWKNNQLIASGECRKFDQYQSGYADLGIIVHSNFRGKGIATEVIRSLVSIAEKQSLIPMCSTEIDNIGAQKAISAAGLVTKHRITQIQFK